MELRSSRCASKMQKSKRKSGLFPFRAAINPDRCESNCTKVTDKIVRSSTRMVSSRYLPRSGSSRADLNAGLSWDIENGLMKRLCQKHLSWSKAVGAAFAFLCVVLGFGPGGNAASGLPRSGSGSSLQGTSQFAIADFDGDKRPHLATVHAGVSNPSHTQYWIAFQLSGGSRHTRGITTPTC